MALSDDIKSSLQILNNSNLISDQTYKKLLEITFLDLLYTKTSDVKSLYGAKADVIKEVHAAILKTLLFLAQTDTTKEKAYLLLTKDCKIGTNRSKLLAEAYDTHKLHLSLKLGNIGSHLPHIVDVDWEIDCLIKSSALDLSQGPLFKVKFITETFDAESQINKLEDFVFWCTTLEMQDLVYKLEDALRHCQKIGTNH
ncbi:COMM domain-containing protein 3 [Atheta coriaria]|uniref:COMM domain-containing protein 3 n=1 Tax=Dalotia coriaria TaxID=877792 RepID=UPI0031F43DF4